MTPQHTNTLIIGASISGLSCAASLQRQNLEYTIIEKENEIAAPWRHHYERLHLHTNKRISNLPFRKFGKAIPRYPSREDVIDYVENYQREFNIRPLFNTNATSVTRSDDHWMTETSNGCFQSTNLIMATGAYSKPKLVHFNGMETFTGVILHSYEYKTGRDFKGQNVLVVGFGNSACEIAMDLYEQGAISSMAVRSPVNVIPRDIAGIPVLELSLMMRRLPPRLADAINAPLIRLLIGDVRKLGLKKKPYGPLQQIRREGNPPVLDIGTIRHIRTGHIKVYDGIDHIAGKRIYFNDGVSVEFDAIVAAIGYYRDYAEIVHVDKSRFEDLNRPIDKQKFFGLDGLYFCGYWISPTGQIREIALDAQKIARDIAKKNR